MFEQKAIVLCQVMQILKKLFLIMTSPWHHQYPYDTHHGVVINRAKFETCTHSSFRGVKTDTQTDRIALYTLDKSMYDAVMVITYYVHRSKRFK